MAELAVLPSRVAYPDRNYLYEKIVYGKGPYVFGSDGQRFFDAACGSGSLILGHGDRQAVETLTEQATKLTIFPGRLFGLDIVEAYATSLVRFAASSIARAVIYSSGSDAVDAALKLALQYHYVRGAPHKTKIIGREASYHGSTLAGLSAGGFIRRRKPYEAALPKISKAAPAYCYDCRFGLAPDTCAVQCASSVEQAILAEGPDTVAAFVAEPIVGAALSAAVPDARYFSRVAEICRRYDVLLIADEVMTGFGRTGRRFGVEHWDLEPDIIVAGKAISAGYFPMSAVLVNRRVADSLEERNQPFQSGNTHACSPLACAIGLHVLDRIATEGLVDRAHRTGKRLLTALKEELRNPWFADIRGLGLMIGIHLEDHRASSADRARLADLVQQLALRRGLIIYASSGSAQSESGEHFLLLPPLTIDESHIDFIVRALAGVCEDLSRMAGNNEKAYA